MVISAAWAPRARPDRLAASSSSSSSSSFRRNSTLWRLLPSLGRRDRCGPLRLVVPIVVSAIPILQSRRKGPQTLQREISRQGLLGLAYSSNCMYGPRPVHTYVGFKHILLSPG